MRSLSRIRSAGPGEKNVGGTERLVRGTLGPALIAIGVASMVGVLALSWGTARFALGGLLVAAGLRMTQTAITQKCYLNERLGRNSYRPESAGRSTSQSAVSDSPARTRR